MIINTLGDLFIDDDTLLHMTQEQAKAFFVNYIRNNFTPSWGLPIDCPVWPSPLDNTPVFGGDEPDWEDIYGE